MIPKNHNKINFKDKIYTDRWGKFLKGWKWYNEEGEWIYCTAGYERIEKTKDFNNNIIENKIRTFIKFIYLKNEWIIDETQKNVLFNLPEIIKTDKSIVIVDNELSVDILTKINGNDFIFTTWTGDQSLIDKTDFSMLKGKKVYYFSSSWVLSKNVIKYFQKNIGSIIKVPPMVERHGWNIYDFLSETKIESDIIKNWITIRTDEITEKKENFIDEIKWPFQILGPGSGYYFFLHGENGQIFKVKQGVLNKSHLQHLASLDFWETEFGYTTKKGNTVISWQDAIDMLIRKCNKKNPFDHNKIRGRGIWQDGNELIIHTGRELIKGNSRIKIEDYSVNGSVYERLPELNLKIEKKDISRQEIKNIKNCVKKLSISNDYEKFCLIGWCVLAPFCGALDWRPHIWLTGPSGSGKTAIINKIILNMLGDFGVYADNDSTGAGFIQNLKGDSFSILHDEVDKSNKNNIEFEIEIARSSSSSKGYLFKGTADQTGRRYRFNFMFCLSSINHSLSKKSDRSRFAIINLKKNTNIEWKKFRSEIENTFNSDICEKIRSLFFYNWKIVKKVIEKFKDKFGVLCGDQRMGDQIGTLFAGACLLYNFHDFTDEEIENIYKKYVSDNIESDDSMTDELELLMKIFTTKIKTLNGDGKLEETTLLYLLKLASGETKDGIPDERAKNELYKYGINYNHLKGKLYIAYKYEWIRGILINTQWYNNYGDVLKRLSFVENKTIPCRFGQFYHGRSVEMKAENVLRLSDDLVYMEAGF